jgi:hypothetical protein|tara:strand:- start:1277 stop:1585 length:309 start_codon:yes stop_codon:yes gene_type:complete
MSKKDACYHKVKRRYKVFPSAYASGAIAKCRKVGAANWGNSKKKKDEGGIMNSKNESKKLMEVAKGLRGASKKHAGQARVIESHVKKMNKSRYHGGTIRQHD